MSVSSHFGLCVTHDLLTICLVGLLVADHDHRLLLSFLCVEL